MKTQIRPLLGALALLALFSTPHLASAYYDPGIQRWINRDPIAELGFEVLHWRRPVVTIYPLGAHYLTAYSDRPNSAYYANTYSLNFNNSINYVDPNGEWSLWIVLPITVILIVVIALPPTPHPIAPPPPPPPRPPAQTAPITCTGHPPGTPGSSDGPPGTADPNHPLNPLNPNRPQEPTVPGDGPWTRPGDWWRTPGEGEGPIEEGPIEAP